MKGQAAKNFNFCAQLTRPRSEVEVNDFVLIWLGLLWDLLTRVPAPRPSSLLLYISP